MQKNLKFKTLFSALLAMVLVINISLPIHAEEETTDLWEDHNVAKAFHYRGIAMNEDEEYVIVGNDGGILYSEDSENWSGVSSPTRSTLFGCTYGKGVFVAAGSNGTIILSEDGREWEVVESGKNILFDAVTFGRDGFVAVGAEPNLTSMGDKRYIYYSKDGRSWEQVYYMEGAFDWRSVSYMNGTYIAHDNFNGDIAFSENGKDWEVLEAVLETGGSDLIWNGKHYISVGSKTVDTEQGDLVFVPHIYRSTDLKEWEEIETNLKEGDYIYEITKYEGFYLMLSSDEDGTKVMISSDFREWDTLINRDFSSVNNVIVNFDHITMVGMNASIVDIYKTKWRSRTTYNTDITKIVYNGKSFIATGHNGYFYRSDDGSQWEEYDSSLDFLIRDCIWANDQYYSLRRVLDDNDEYTSTEIYASSDGEEWSLKATIEEGDLERIRFINNKYIAFGENGIIYTSDNAVNWSKANSNSDAWLSDVNYFDGIYYAVGMFGTLLTSEDAKVWSSQILGDGGDLNAIATNGKSLIIVGDYMDSYYTEDGSNWTNKESYSEENYDRVLWDGKNYVMFTYSGNYYKTDDGVNFLDYYTDLYGDIESVCWDGYKYIVGGRQGAISTCVPTDLIKIVVRDQPIIFDVAPQIISDRTMIPARAVFEEMDAVVSWDGETKSVLIDNDNTSIVITIGSNTAKVNGVEKTLDSPAVIVNGRTLVPVRFISEELGMSIDWDSTTKTVSIQ